MGGPGSGRKADPRRQRLAAVLRARGLTFAAIGRRLGVTPEAARQMALAAAGRPAPPRCASCAGPLPMRSRGGRCPACVAADPDAPFAERLRALRLAAGLTGARLAARAGLREPGQGTDHPPISTWRLADTTREAWESEARRARGQRAHEILGFEN